MNTRKASQIVLCIVAAAAVIVLMSNRTSPIYSLYLMNYGNDTAAAGMVIGKYWLQGTVPYRDLFTIGGPVYFLLQALGWLLGERTGIFLLQIASLSVYLWYNKKALALYAGEGLSILASLCSLFFYAAMCSAGNSSAEWCLPMASVVIYHVLNAEKNDGYSCKSYAIIGLACALTIMTHLQGAGISIAVMVFAILRGLLKKDKNIWWLLAGFMLPIAIVCVYFMAAGAFWLMIDGAVLYPLEAMLEGFDRKIEVVHKAIKCMLAMPLLLAGIMQYIRGKKAEGIILGMVALCTMILLMMGDNQWYYYMTAIPTVTLGIIILCSEKQMLAVIIAGFCVLGVIGIAYIPLMNSCRTLYKGEEQVIYDFYADLEECIETTEDCKVRFEDTDPTFYLLMDEKPSSRYFTDQTEIAHYDAEAAHQIQHERYAGYHVIITTEHGWQGQNIEGYALVQVYFTNYDNLCVYIVME